MAGRESRHAVPFEKNVTAVPKLWTRGVLVSNAERRPIDKALLNPREVDVHPAAVAPDPHYRRTLFDRLGPNAGNVLKAWSYAVKTFGLCLLVFSSASSMMPMTWYARAGFVLGASLAGTLTTLCFVFGASEVAAALWSWLMLSGASTPYQEQFSRQQALVMKGRIEEALRSYEELIEAADPGIDPAEARLRAAELYAGGGRNALRAAVLLRQVQRLPRVAAGTDIHATNRLVDLYLGPLAEPHRALVELRRLIERYPRSPAAQHARVALAKLKRDGADQS